MQELEKILKHKDVLLATKIKIIHATVFSITMGVKAEH